MRRLLLLLALAIPAFAITCPTGTIEIADTLYGTDGTPWAGTINTTLSINTTNAGRTFVGQLQSVKLAAGALDICRAPGRYTVTKVSTATTTSGTLTVNSVWIVPTSGGPYQLSSIPSGTANTAGTAVTWSSGITFAAVAAGDAVAIAGLQYVVASVQSTTSLTLKTTAGVQTGASFSDGPVEQASNASAVTAIYGPPGTPGTNGTGNAPYFASVTSLTTLAVSAATHGQGIRPVPYCWDSTGHGIACDPAVDAYGNLSFSWPVAFTGAITVLGGGTGATGATGAQGPAGPTGPAGTIGVFGSAPTTVGTWCPQVVVTAGPSYAYGWATCGGPLSWASLTNGQWTALTNSQWTGMTN